MKVSRTRLKQIIQEELRRSLREGTGSTSDIVDNIVLGYPDEAAQAALDMWGSYEEIEKWVESSPDFSRVDEDSLEDFMMEVDWLEGKRGRAAKDPELNALSDVFTYTLTPDLVKHIAYKPRLRGGKLSLIELEDGSGGDAMIGNMMTSMDPADAREAGTNLKAVVAYLEANGARLLRPRRAR